MTASAYAPGIGTASYCCSPGATAVKLFSGGELVVGDPKAPWATLGVAERALLGGAWSLKGFSVGLAPNEDTGSAAWGPGVKLGAADISEREL